MARKGKYSEWLQEEKLILIEGWAKDGLTEKQIAKNMGISEVTLNDWKKKFPQLLKSLKKGKEIADYEIENELYLSAHTRTIKIKKAVKVRTTKKDGTKVLQEEHIEYVEEDYVVPANVTAQIFWLKNRRPDKWKDKPDYVASEVYEDDGLLAALDAAVADLEDDSWMVEDEES